MRSVVFFYFHTANVSGELNIRIQKRVSKNTNALFKAFKKGSFSEFSIIRIVTVRNIVDYLFGIIEG